MQYTRGHLNLQRFDIEVGMPGELPGNGGGSEAIADDINDQAFFMVSQYRPATAATRRILRVLVTCVREGQAGISSTQLAERALVSWSSAKLQLQRLMHAGIVRRSGRARASRYWLVEDKSEVVRRAKERGEILQQVTNDLITQAIE
jgi:predicted transcriptional regulator